MYDESDVSLSSDSDVSPPQIEKRQYHNLLERNRRNILKSSFSKLKNAVPSLAKKNSKGASRAKILRRSIAFIRRSQLKKSARDKDIRDLKAENKVLEDQIRAMECITESTSLSSIRALMQICSGVDSKSRFEEPLTDSEEESEEDSEDESRYSVEDDCDSPSDRSSKASPENDVQNSSNAFSSSLAPSQLDVSESDSETDTDSDIGDD